MTLTLSATIRSALADVIGDALDGGSIQIRSGSRPAGPGSTATGTLLATVVLESPAFTESGGVLTLVDPDAVTAAADGTATWCRFLNASSAAVMDGKVTGTGGGGDLTLATTTITSGLSVDVTGGTITQPAGTAD